MNETPTREKIQQARRNAAEFVNVISREAARHGVRPAIAMVMRDCVKVTKEHGFEEAVSGLLSVYMTLMSTAIVNNLLSDYTDPADELEAAAAKIRKNMAALREGGPLMDGTIGVWTGGPYGQGGSA